MHLDKKSTGLEIQHKKKQCPKIFNETKKTLNLLHTQEIEKTFVFAKQKHYAASPKLAEEQIEYTKLRRTQMWNCCV